MQGLSVGRVAHFVPVNAGDHKAATITNIISEHGTVDLVILDARATPPAQGILDVPYSEQPLPGTWHWPEKV